MFIYIPVALRGEPHVPAAPRTEPRASAVTQTHIDHPLLLSSSPSDVKKRSTLRKLMSRIYRPCRVLCVCVGVHMCSKHIRIRKYSCRWFCLTHLFNSTSVWVGWWVVVYVCVRPCWLLIAVLPFIMTESATKKHLAGVVALWVNINKAYCFVKQECNTPEIGVLLN